MEDIGAASGIQLAKKRDLFDLLAFLENRLPETCDVIFVSVNFYFIYSTSYSLTYSSYIIIDSPESGAQDRDVDGESPVLLRSTVRG